MGFRPQRPKARRIRSIATRQCKCIGIALLGPANLVCSVVVPTSIMTQWVSEICKLAPGLRVVKHYGPSRTTGERIFPFPISPLTIATQILRSLLVRMSSYVANFYINMLVSDLDLDRRSPPTAPSNPNMRIINCSTRMGLQISPTVLQIHLPNLNGRLVLVLKVLLFLESNGGVLC